MAAVSPSLWFARDATASFAFRSKPADFTFTTCTLVSFGFAISCERKVLATMLMLMAHSCSSTIFLCSTQSRSRFDVLDDDVTPATVSFETSDTTVVSEVRARACAATRLPSRNALTYAIDAHTCTCTSLHSITHYHTHTHTHIRLSQTYPKHSHTAFRSCPWLTSFPSGWRCHQCHAATGRRRVFPGDNIRRHCQPLRLGGVRYRCRALS